MVEGSFHLQFLHIHRSTPPSTYSCFILLFSSCFWQTPHPAALQLIEVAWPGLKSQNIVCFLDQAAPMSCHLSTFFLGLIFFSFFVHHLPQSPSTFHPFSLPSVSSPSPPTSPPRSIALLTHQPTHPLLIHHLPALATTQKKIASISYLPILKCQP